jgi:hypothetical protein
MTVTVDALKGTASGETRVAVTPASVQRLRASEIDVLVERDAGAGALLPARTHTDAGARVDDAEQLIRRADAVLAIHAPDAPRAQLRRGQLLCGLLQACTTIELVAALDDAGVIAARQRGSPIAGMPILDVDHAKTIVVIKRSMRHGYAGIDNELHTNPKTRMYFTDAKQALSANHVRDQDPRR